ncbi:hypothetical protein Q3G72_021238 [Acer saccharum]|nr:hypothetical protein Q3G72_021238 [Acer saccharum]
MDPIATGAAADPEAPPHTTQLPEIDQYASSSQGPRNQDNAQTYNWPILDLLPSENSHQYYRICVPLYDAALNGDWEKARGLIEGNQSMVRTAITEGYETALQVATKAEKTGFALMIMEHMNEQDLTLQDRRGDTAFCFAVATANRQLAEVMLSKNPDLATLRGSGKMTPLNLAVLLGKEDMAMFLYPQTGGLTPEERACIFFLSIKTDLYGMASELLLLPGELAVTRDMNGDTALHLLSRKHPSIFAGRDDQILDMKKGVCFLMLLLSQVTSQQNVDFKELIRHPSNLLFDAARMGNLLLLSVIIRFYPDMVFELDENKRTIFHIAILHRQSSIFKLLHELGYVRELIATYVDAQKNTLLHMAAKHPDQSLASTAALKIQQELQLFKVKLSHSSLS